MEALKPRSKKKISKKRKSAIRKYVQVKEVEEYFRDKRIEDRLGNFANEQDIENLFMTNEDELTESVPKKARISKDFVLKSHFPPSLDDHIKPIRNPAPNKAKVICSSRPKVTCQVKVSVDADDDENNESVEKSQTNYFDIWGSSGPDLTKDVDIHGKRVCRLIPVKPPSHIGRKPSEIPAIPIPLPGTSYNPSLQDHKELLSKAYEIELNKLKKEAKIINATDKMFPLKSEAPTQKTWLKEMSQGLPGMEEEEVKEENVEEVESLRTHKNPPVRREDKKTEKERKKMKERKVEEKMIKMEKNKKLKEAEKFKINTAKKLLRQEEMRLAVRRSWRRLKVEENKNMPKKLGKVRFLEPDLDLKLLEEKVDSLRVLKPEGHILRDLVSSIQRRNMAPASTKGEPKKRQRRYKPKVFEKPGHKAITL